MKNSCQRILFWIAFVAFAAVLGRTGYYHFFGVGYLRPVLVTEQRILDLGVVPPDSLTEVEFTVTNSGMHSLQIESVRTGCAGCIEIISYSTAPIRRNESMLVRIALDTTKLKGKVRKSILILSNDPIQRIYPMLIDAVVEQREQQDVSDDLEDVEMISAE